MQEKKLNNKMNKVDIEKHAIIKKMRVDMKQENNII